MPIFWPRRIDPDQGRGRPGGDYPTSGFERRKSPEPDEHGMFPWRTPRRGRRAGSPARAWRFAGCLALRTAKLAVTLALVTFVTAGVSQACSQKDGSAPADVQITHQIAARDAQVAHQTTVERHIIEIKSAEVSSVVKFGVINTNCCANGAGHCHGHGCAGSCCAACSSGLIAAGWSIVQGPSLHDDFPCVQPSFHPTELESQFRPPRTHL